MREEVIDTVYLTKITLIAIIFTGCRPYGETFVINGNVISKSTHAYVDSVRISLELIENIKGADFIVTDCQLLRQYGSDYIGTNADFIKRPDDVKTLAIVYTNKVGAFSLTKRGSFSLNIWPDSRSEIDGLVRAVFEKVGYKRKSIGISIKCVDSINELKLVQLEPVDSLSSF